MYQTMERVLTKYGMTLLLRQSSKSFYEYGYECFNTHYIQSAINGSDYNPTLGHSHKQHVIDTIAYELFDQFYCKITDMDQWLRAFNINSHELPLPKEYVKAIRFQFRPTNQNNIHFATNIGMISQLAECVDKDIETVRSELDPSYSITSLFHPREAAKSSRFHILSLIRSLENSLNTPPMEKFKSELAETLLICIGKDRNFLEHLDTSPEVYRRL